MSEPDLPNPAVLAADKALSQLYGCLDAGKSFVFEAGAGAGKTHSLVKALEHVLQRQGDALLRSNRKIACITYTNVASAEIASRSGAHPAVHSSTIHSFCWSLLQAFQPAVRSLLPEVGKWRERLGEAGGADGLPVIYDLGYPAVRDGQIMLGHADVIPLTVRCMAYDKFRRLFVARYPVLFIDEYQDTNRDFAESIKTYFLGSDRSPLIGFFGDQWQKIYGDGCGGIEHPALERIAKGANFRSVPAVVNLLNAMRPDLRQEVEDPSAEGSVCFYHANGWGGERRTDGHSKGDLPEDAVHAHLEDLKSRLAAQGWEMGGGRTKILMLTHRSLAAEQGYAGVLEAFDRNESWTSKEDPLIEFMVDSLEPACLAFWEKRYGEMFAALGRKVPKIRRHSDKLRWHDSFSRLIELRESGTVGDVLRHLDESRLPPLPEKVERRWREYVADLASGEGFRSRDSAVLSKLDGVPYREMAALARFLEENSLFDTQHGVKGAEFENVIVVIGRGWNQYDFNSMLEWCSGGVPKGKEAAYERARNLFYVACSRPRKRLAVLFTQELTAEAQSTLASWAGADRIIPLDLGG